MVESSSRSGLESGSTPKVPQLTCIPYFDGGHTIKFFQTHVAWGMSNLGPGPIQGRVGRAVKFPGTQIVWGLGSLRPAPSQVI